MRWESWETVNTTLFMGGSTILLSPYSIIYSLCQHKFLSTNYVPRPVLISWSTQLKRADFEL